MPLVSIIMPYFKKDLYVEKTIESIIDQSHKELEIIIIDDELSKNSNEVLKKIQKKDQRIKIIFNEQNLGAGESRNKGISFAQGEYVAFCDCDDLWNKYKLEEQLKFMKDLRIDFSYTSYEIIDKNSNIIGFRDASYDTSFKSLLLSCDIGLSTVVLKKRFFDNQNYFFPKIKTKEDFVVWLKLLKDGVEMKGLDKKLTSWRKLNDSLSSSPLQKIFDGYKVYRYYLKFNIIKSFMYLFLLSINYLIKR